MTSAYMMSTSVKLNILVAFPYFSQNIYKFLMDKDPSTFRLIVDSGAFTAWNTGKHISMEDYCKFLKTIPSHWEYKAVQLDVYGNPEQTYTNYLRMLDAGYKDVMPVFTRGDTVERLKNFIHIPTTLCSEVLLLVAKTRTMSNGFAKLTKADMPIG